MIGKGLNLKINIPLILKALFLFFLISLASCQSPEALPENDLPDVDNNLREEVALPEEEVIEEEAETGDAAEIEEFDPNILLTLSFLAGDYIISPDGNLLYFTVPSAPGTLNHEVDLPAVEIGLETVPEIEWEAMEPLETPSIMGFTYHLQISGDGSNLLYATSEDQWDETDYGEKKLSISAVRHFPLTFIISLN